jgi:cobaltochelatase CobN
VSDALCPIRRPRWQTHLSGATISDAALILACVGCCCGHPERGGPKTPPRVLKREMRRAFRHAGLDGRARLAFSDCLGPCSEANVIFLYLGGRPVWLRRINEVGRFEVLLDWLRQQLDGGGPALPPPLAARAFAWTGGGEGPAPPIDDRS